MYCTAPTVHSLGHRSNPQGALLQAAGLGAEGEVGAIGPNSNAGWFRSGVHPPWRDTINRCITSVLSKVFQRLVLVCLRRFMEQTGMLPTAQFAYQKGLGTCNVLLCMSHTLQSSLESGQEISD